MNQKKIERNTYLNKLINKKENGLIKIITGIRRCGKSYLLNELFVDYLKNYCCKRHNETLVYRRRNNGYRYSRILIK